MAKRSGKSTRQTPSSASSDPLSPEDQFMAILNNRGQTDPGSGPPRERGFVVVADGTPSLQFLQSLCYWDVESYCFTARYRLGVGPVFGTLLASFLSDFEALARNPSSDAKERRLLGELMPRPDPGSPRRGTPWLQLEAAMTQLAGLEIDPSADVLSRREVGTALGFFEEVLDPGDRIVLFCELPEYRSDAVDAGPRLEELVRDWSAAQSVLGNLPQRVGIVFGFPDDYFANGLSLSGPPHQTRLSFSGEDDPASELVARFKPAALAGDYAATHDAFGLESEARAIARLILHPQTDPMTISIEAPWGQGKSSFLNFVGRALTEIAAERMKPSLAENYDMLRDSTEVLDQARAALSLGSERGTTKERDEARRESEKALASVRRLELSAWARMVRAAQREVLQVRFNAWRHQDATHVWAGLVSEVSKAVERSLPWWRRWSAPLTYALRNRASEVVVGVVLPTILAIAIAATLTFVGVRADPQDLVADVPFVLKLLVPGSAVAALLAWRLYRVIQPVSQRVLDYVRLPDYRDQLGFQEQVLRDLGYLRRLLRRRRLVWRGRRPAFERRDPRIVVFIDDLDRCPDDKVMEILQTVNLVLVQGAESEGGSDGSQGAFVLLAVDTDKIHQAIEHHYAKQGASTADPEFAQSYLRKIIQLPYYLPEPPQDRRLSLIQGFFSYGARLFSERSAEKASENSTAATETGDAPKVEGFRIARDAVLSPRVKVFTEVEDTPTELSAFRVLAEFLPDNPREMKRLLNVHRFVKILLQRPEAPPDDAVQRKLVAWLIFCARWERFVDPLIDYANRVGGDSSRDSLEALEEIDETVGRFRQRLAALDASLTIGDLSRKGILAEAASRTRVLPRAPAG